MESVFHHARNQSSSILYTFLSILNLLRTAQRKHYMNIVCNNNGNYGVHYVFVRSTDNAKQ